MQCFVNTKNTIQMFIVIIFAVNVQSLEAILAQTVLQDKSKSASSVPLERLLLQWLLLRVHG